LPAIDFLRLAPGSHLIDAGVNVGLPFNGSAPDLGWAETAAVVPALLGDYDGNGTVDLADYVVWRDNLNTATTLPNDATPGTIDASDYDVWRAHFGQVLAGGTSSASTSPVPEPISALYLCTVAILLLAGRTSFRPSR
jgi:hypothetical protein